MEELRQYVISLTAAGVICGIVLTLGRNGSTEKLLKLICGLFLAFMMVRPVSNLAVGNFEALGITWEQDGEAAAEQGRELAQKSLAERIKQESESYILDKARALEAELSVEVTVSRGEPPVPISVTLRGEIPPYLRQLLTQIIKTDLGIPKERQTWIS